MPRFDRFVRLLVVISMLLSTLPPMPVSAAIAAQQPRLPADDLMTPPIETSPATVPNPTTASSSPSYPQAEVDPITLAARNGSATHTPAPTNYLAANSTSSSSFPSTGVLDDFNRSDGAIGGNWSGVTLGYSIANNHLNNVSGGDIYWSQTAFGSNQEAYVTLVNIDQAGDQPGLGLKAQSNSSWAAGGIAVIYDPVADFAAGPLIGSAPLTVTFRNDSSYGTDYLWDFGDSLTSTGISPVHVYTTPGVYTVSLTTSGPGGSLVPYNENYTYNTIGNLTARNNQSYTYGSGRPHAVTAVTTNTYTYDANGNMTRRVEGGVTYTQTWNVENKLERVTWVDPASGRNRIVRYVYDGDGTRLLKIEQTYASPPLFQPVELTTVYIGQVYEEQFNTTASHLLQASMGSGPSFAAGSQPAVVKAQPVSFRVPGLAYPLPATLTLPPSAFSLQPSTFNLSYLLFRTDHRSGQADHAPPRGCTGLRQAAAGLYGKHQLAGRLAGPPLRSH